MYDPADGEILIDDKPLQQWDLEALRSQISYVPQDVFLFSDTINANIAFGNPEAENLDTKAAAKTAHIDKEILQLQDQYETIVGERGVMLSGGQKQRVSIARALAKPHSLLILDDSISAVDNTTEQYILNNLEQSLQSQTVLIITHRLFKNWNFDKIIVMDDGKIAEQGTHEELLQQQGFYYEMYQYQMNSE